MNDATIQSIKKVSLAPGDVLVCNFRQRLAKDECARVKQTLHDVFGYENKILVTEDAQIYVVRRHRPSIMQRARALRRLGQVVAQ